MKIDKNFKGLEYVKNSHYVFNGDLKSEESIEIDLSRELRVHGSITTGGKLTSRRTVLVDGSILANDTIFVQVLLAAKYINSHEDIYVDGSIYSIYSISAEGQISAKDTIEASRGSIKAGRSIKAGTGIFAKDLIIAEKGCIESGAGITAGKTIRAKSFISAKGRIFSNMLPLGIEETFCPTIVCDYLKDGVVAYGKLKTNKPEVVMTLDEIREKLGIKNLKIKN